jgi:hypothetical protein
MKYLFNHPFAVFVLSFAVLWFAVWFGASILRKRRTLQPDEREDLGVVLAATLTLLALIIGFSFSMAINRYDERKNLEEAEANAIGTEYLRADLLPDASAAKVRTLLKDYSAQRLLFYAAQSEPEILENRKRTTQLQTELWEAVSAPAAAQPTPTVALAVSGMNDVINAEGYVQAAWWNRIPVEAWMLMLAIATACNVLVGYSARSTWPPRILRLALPAIIAISFYLIADIDSPRGGLIRVVPQNLAVLVESMGRP